MLGKAAFDLDAVVDAVPLGGLYTAFHGGSSIGESGDPIACVSNGLTRDVLE